jgi:Leucine-rich repeat (LRR) protein
MKLLNTLFILFLFGIKTIGQIPIMPAKELTHKRLFEDIKISSKTDTKEIKPEEKTNKTTDRLESDRLKFNIENQKLSRILGIEFKKTPYVPSQILEIDNCSFTVFYGLLQKIDSVYYQTSTFKFDTLTKRGGFTNFNAKLNEESHLFIQNIIANTLKRYTVNLTESSSFKIQGTLSFGQRGKTKSEETLKNEFIGKVLNMSDTLSILKFQNFNLRTFPEELYKFKKAKVLDLSNNKLTQFKINTRKFKSLEKIILSDNALSENAIKISRNKKIKIISLVNNDLSEIPKNVSKSKKLEELLVSNNLIEYLQGCTLRKFKKLRVLNLYNCNLKVISPGIKHLSNLEVLDVYHNQLKYLPKEITSLSKLSTLAIANNNLWDLPNELNKMENLHMLYAHHNRLNRLPELPKNIALLDIGFNLFAEVPNQLKYLNKLEELDISNNKMKDLASELLHLNALKSVFLYNNDFEEDPIKFEELKQIIVDLKKKSVKVK